MKKVVKFGGSSLANAKQFKKVADIIKADKSRRYVVPSAPGKRNDKDEKVTDMLYACYDAVAEGRSYKKILDKIKERYNEIIDGLDLNLNLDHEFDKIEENFLAKAGRDYAASRGEYLMVSLWQIIWDMNSSMLQKLFSLMIMETLKQILRIKSFLSD